MTQTEYPQQTSPPPDHLSGPESAQSLDVPTAINPSLPPPAFRTYTVYRSKTPYNYRIYAGTDKSSPAIYYVNNSQFMPGTPDVQLRSGPGRSGPVLAFAKFAHFCTSIVIGHGDPTGKDGTEAAGLKYEQLRKGSAMRHRMYSFSTADETTAGGQRRRYYWRRHRQLDLRRVYECVDDGNGRRIAVFLDSTFGNFLRLGQMSVMVEAPVKFHQILLVSWLAMREKACRHNRYAGGGGGGGGGGA